MKILHIHPSLASGGIEAMIAGLANEMVKTEDVSIGLIFKTKESDIFLHQLNKIVKVFSLGKTGSGISLPIIWKIYRTILKGKYDVVNIHGFFYYYVLAVLLCRRHTTFFYTVHSDATMENSKWDRKLLPFKKFCFRHKWINAITISPASEKSFEKLYGCRGSLISNGIQRKQIDHIDILADYRFTPNTRIFIHAGRISYVKNQEMLCRIFDRLIKNGKDVVLLIAGNIQDNDIFSRLQKYFTERIIYLGERNDVIHLMAYSDAMCLPSIWEGLPVVLLEALSVGCVPICSPVGGIVDVVTDGYNGCLSKSYRENDYYNTLINFLKIDDLELEKFKQRCKDSFGPYDIHKTAYNYLNLYQSLL